MSHDREPPVAASAARTSRMTPAVRRVTIGLSGIYGLRILGMFIALTTLWLAVDATMAAPPVYNDVNYSMGES